MGIGFSSIIPYTMKSIIPPTIYTSTVADSTTFTATRYGANYILSIECLAGNLMVDATGAVATTASGWQIPAGESITFMVSKNTANPTSLVSIFGLSTTDKYQAIIWN